MPKLGIYGKDSSISVRELSHWVCPGSCDRSFGLVMASYELQSVLWMMGFLIPNVAIVSYTSNRPENDVASC